MPAADAKPIDPTDDPDAADTTHAAHERLDGHGVPEGPLAWRIGRLHEQLGAARSDLAHERDRADHFRGELSRLLAGPRDQVETLRDRFAAAAMTGLLSDKERTTAVKELLLGKGMDDAGKINDRIDLVLALQAYMIADSMLRVRQSSGRAVRPSGADRDRAKAIRDGLGRETGGMATAHAELAPAVREGDAALRAGLAKPRRGPLYGSETD